MQEMTYMEREHMKTFNFGDQACHVITMIAHWHRQRCAVHFSEYAANWAAAQTKKDVSRLREAWPHNGMRMIRDDCSDWQEKQERTMPKNIEKALIEKKAELLRLEIAAGELRCEILEIQLGQQVKLAKKPVRPRECSQPTTLW